MKVIFEESDFIENLTPNYNGCRWNLIIHADGSYYLDIGCYLLVNLTTGASREWLNMYRNNGDKPFKIDIHPKIIVKILDKLRDTGSCRCCGGTIFHKIREDSANFNINQQPHGGQSVSQPAPNCLTATSPC